MMDDEISKPGPGHGTGALIRARRRVRPSDKVVAAHLPFECFLEHHDVLMAQRLEHADLPISRLLHDLVLVRRLLELLDCHYMQKKVLARLVKSAVASRQIEAHLPCSPFSLFFAL